MSNSENMKKLNENTAENLKENAMNAVELMQIKVMKNKFYLIMSAISAIAAVIGVQYTKNLSFVESLILQILFSTIASAAYATAIVLKPGFTAILSPAASVAFSLILTRDITALLLPLSYILTGFMIGYCIINKKSRIQTVTRAGLITALSLTVLLGYQLYLYKGFLSYDAFYDTVMDISRELVNFYKQANPNAGEIFEKLSPIDLFSDTIKTFIGAFILILGFLQAHIVGFITKLLMKRTNLHDEYFEFDPKWELAPSKTAAIIFLAAILVYSSFQNISNIGLMAASALIIFPIGAGLALVGVKSFNAILKGGSLFTYIIVLLIIFGMMSFLAFVMILLVFIGLVRTLIRNTKLDLFKNTDKK